MATHNIIVAVQARGTRIVQRDIENIGRSSDRTAQTLMRLQRIMNLIATGMGVGALRSYADEYTNIQNKVLLATKDLTSFNNANDRLMDIANRTRTSLEATTTLFQRTSAAISQYGKDNDDALAFVENLNKAVIVSGAGSVEAANAIRQLSQGLAKGRLDGDELRSVLEQLPFVADVIAQEFGVARGALRDLGAEGQLTPIRILNAFQKYEGYINQQFLKTQATFEQSWTQIRNVLVAYVGQMNDAIGVSRGFGNVAAYIVGDVRGFSNALAILTGVVIALAGGAALGALIWGIRTLFTLIRAHPFMFLISAAAGLITWFGQTVKATNKVEQALLDASNVGDIFVATWSGAIAYVQSAFGDFENWIENAAKRSANAIGKTFAEGVNKMIAALPGWEGREIPQLKNASAPIFPDIGEDATKAGQNAADAFHKAYFNSLEEAQKRRKNRATTEDNGGWTPPTFNPDDSDGKAGKVKADPWADYIKSLKQQEELLMSVRGLERERLGEIFKAEDAAGGALTIKQLELVDDLLSSIQSRTFDEAYSDTLNNLDQQAELLQKNVYERERLTQVYQIQEQLGRELSDIEKGEIDRKIQLLQQLELEAEYRAKTVDAMEETKLRLLALDSVYAQGAISLAGYRTEVSLLNAELINQKYQVEDNLISMTELAQTSFTSIIEGYQGISIGLIDTFSNMFTTLSQGFSNMIGDWLVNGGSLKTMFGDLARQILSQMIGTLIQLGIQWGVSQLLAMTSIATTTAAQTGAMATTGTAAAAATAANVAVQTAAAGTIAAAYAPAAAMASLASFGGNAAPAMLGIQLTTAMAMAMSKLSALPGFEEGGYTGNAGRKDVSGVVHGQEFVMNAGATRKNRRLLEAMNDGEDVDLPYAFNVGDKGSSSGVNVTIVNQAGGVEFEVRQVTERDVEVIARKVVSEETDKITAGNITNNSSKTSRALKSNTNSGRRYGS